MLKMMAMYYRLCLSRYSLLSIAGFVIFLCMLKVTFLRHVAKSYSVNITAWDFMFFSMGGVKVHDSFILIIGWVLLFCPLLLLNYNLFGRDAIYDLFFLSRAGSKFKLWVSKTVVNVMIASSYSLVVIITHLVVALLLYPTSNSWSGFYSTMDMTIPSGGSPLTYVGYVCALFVTGIILFGATTQLFSAIFNNKVTVYMVWTVLLFVLLQLCLFQMIPRNVSPMLYPSTLDLLLNDVLLSSIKKEIISNLVSLSICVPVIYLVNYLRRYEL